MRWQMPTLLTRIGQGGRLVIPAEYRKALGVGPGDEVLLLLEEGSLRVLTLREAIRLAQAAVRSYIPDGSGRSLADELIAERRQESQRE
jgi:AbrB family looped-hinge helix DNA binding protein